MKKIKHHKKILKHHKQHKVEHKVEKEHVKTEILDSYTIDADKIKVHVKIIESKNEIKQYSITFPELSPATLALLDEIKARLIIEVKVTAKEILDPTVVNELKNKFSSLTDQMLTKKLPSLDIERRQLLTGLLIQEMIGLGKLEFLINDPYLEEIVVNTSSEGVFVYHKKFGWLKSNLVIPSESQVQNYASVIARRVGRQITTLTPLLDAHLTTGDRVNAVLYPISNRGNTITIRKFARDPWTITDMISNKTVSYEIMALIWLAIQYEMNMLISGGTASGKTSFLNICMPFIPPNHRIISIEDTRELTLPKFLFWTPLTTRQPNPEGKGSIDMLDLLVNSLRMRPDRIVLGEMRRKQEAEVLFEAMHTGHSVYATVHADSLNETINRLTHPPIDIPQNLLTSVNLNIVMFRDRRLGIRRMFQVGEYIVPEKGDVRTNLLYRWDPTSDTIVKHGESLRLFEDLSRHTGLNEIEINKDLEEKKHILELLVKYGIRDVNDVGKVMSQYYANPSTIHKIIEALRK